MASTKDRDATEATTAQAGAIILTHEQLQTLITASVSAALAGRPGPSLPAPMTEDEKLADLARQYSGVDRAVPREKLVPCVSEDTGATFTARVIESRSDPNGRIVELLDYKRPDGCDRHVDDMPPGLVPKGLMIHRSDNGHPTLQYKQWLWTTFWQADLRRFVGLPLKTRFRANPDAPQEEWRDPRAPVVETPKADAAE